MTEGSVNTSSTGESDSISSSEVETASSCRGCGAEGLEVMLSLGSLPLANALVPEAQLGGTSDAIRWISRIAPSALWCR